MSAPGVLIIGEESCGCRIVERVEDSSVFVGWCPLHENAAGVATAARRVVDAWDVRYAGAITEGDLGPAMQALERVA